MTIEELYLAFDNVTRLTKFYIVTDEEDILEWGCTYHEISHEKCSLTVEHFKYNDGEIIIWV